MDQAMTAAQPSEAGDGPRFYAHAREEGRHRDHYIPGARCAQEAALIFAEHWSAADASATLAVVVLDAASGERRCFTIDLDAGEAGPCS